VALARFFVKCFSFEPHVVYKSHWSEPHDYFYPSVVIIFGFALPSVPSEPASLF